MKRTGFTLIELLVVIAIIAILAAILFPVLSSAKENARVASCQSNLKQLGYAFQMYLDDSNGRYPYGMAVSNWSDTSVYPWKQIAKYTTAKNMASLKGTILMCPSAKDLRKCVPGWFTTSYGYLAAASVADWNKGHGLYDYSTKWRTRCNSELRHPSKTICIADSAIAYINYQEYYLLGLIGDWNIGFKELHNQGANVLYCDGHIKRCDRKDMKVELLYMVR
ncbi:MAG: prepilin-type N-terminal cleavage/methylation domain-containing protein [Armatimonadota bacterium]